MIKKTVINIIFLMLCFVAFTQEELNYNKIMRSAIDNENYTVAMNAFAQAEEEDYYDLEALKRMVVEILYSQKDYAKAIEMSEYLYNEDENSNLTDLVLMACLAKDKKNDTKIGEIASKFGSPNLEKNILLQIKRLNKKDIDNIIQSVKRYISKEEMEDKKELKPYKTLLTILYYNNEQYMDAYNMSIDYLTLNNQPVIYYILGILREKRGEYLSAISFLSMAIKNGYNHYDAYLQRAICFGFEKDYVSSNTDLDTCIMIDSNFYPFYLKGINYNFMKQYQDAMLCLDYSITLNDTFADAYNYRGIVSSNIKEYSFAVLDFKHAIELDRKTPYVHNNLGIALEKTGKYEEAIKEYKLSTKLEPNLSDAWYNLGRIYTDNKQTKKAIKYLKKANELDSEIPDTYYLLGINYQRKKDKDKACFYYHKALELSHTLAQNKIDNYCNKDTTEIEQDNNEEELQDEILEEELQKEEYNKENFDEYENKKE